MEAQSNTAKLKVEELHLSFGGVTAPVFGEFALVELA